MSFSKEGTNKITVTSLTDQEVVVPKHYALTDFETWSESKKECQKKGGDLVVIPNEAKNTKVIEFMKTKDVEEYEGGYNIQRTGRCSDISGALPITNKQECWDARDSLGYSGASVGSWSWLPQGCTM